MPGRLVGADDGRARQPGVLPDAVDARAAHPAREGDVEHLHQPGADRADGDGVHDGLRQAGAARTGGAEPGQGALPGGEAEAAVLGTVLQRVRGEAGRQDAGRGQQGAAEEENHRRAAAGAVLSGTGGFDAAVRDGDDAARGHGRGGGGAERDHESPHPHFAERSAAVRAQLAGQEGVPAAGAGRAGGGSRRGAGRGERARGDRGLPGSERGGGDPPLHAAFDVELRDRLRHVSAGLVHDEVQPADQRAGGADRGPGVGASVSAGSAVAGRRWK